MDGLGCVIAIKWQSPESAINYVSTARYCIWVALNLFPIGVRRALLAHAAVHCVRELPPFALAAKTKGCTEADPHTVCEVCETEKTMDETTTTR